MSLKKAASYQDAKPNAWIVNSSDRGRKSIKNINKIYLDNNQEFQIELYNPLTQSVLADIRINSKSVSKSGLVLRPGQRFYLDCSVDDRKKFIFKTYEVEDTDQNHSAIASNGIVEVFFYKEETVIFNNWSNRLYNRYPYNTFPYGNKITFGNLTTSGSSAIVGSTTTYSNSNLQNISLTSTPINNSSYSLNSMMETGRIEKGETSSQKFTEIDMEFEKYHISSVMYQILPMSQKPVETEDLRKKFCDECGFKLKGSEKFCPNCGHKL